ncbi:Wzz/FepE/Etk N-terminal domain-containing protein [Pseudomonadota bacterium]|nr:Wzz/FepE/Etk N-terminal domain-containing protein [Pseudomonadota bacterium]
MNDFDNNKRLDDEIVFKELVTLLWLNKKFIVILTSFFALVSVLYSLSITNLYTAQTLIAPTSSSVNSSSLSQFSGLASMAGINLPQTGGENQVDVALNLVNSKKLLDRLMLYESFLPDLIAAKSWNMQTNTVTYYPDLYDKKNNQWVREVSLPYKQIPSSQEALKIFSDLVSISQDKKTQLIALKVSHLSPVVAQQWSFWILKETNAILANMQIIKSQASIDYLNSQIKITPYSELRTMFYALIQESTKSMMLAKVNPEYVMTTIDPPVIPEMKSQPKRAVICILGALLGGMLSIFIILILKYGFNRDDELDILKLLKSLRQKF